MKKYLVFALVLAATLNGRAQTEVTTYQPGVTENGITYFLPRTGLHFTLVATRVIHKPGEYCQYAERYLRLKNVTQARYEEWSIKSIDVTSYGTADKRQAYSIKLKSKTSAPLVSLASDGRLLGVNVDKVAGDAKLSQPSVVKEKTKQLNPADYKTEEILAAGSTTKMAELTANEIYDIRDNRSQLSKGQADFMPKDGEQLRIMLAQLDTQEEALLQLFKGTTETETHTFAFDYVPDGALSKGILFRFSKHLGLVDNDDLAGAPFYITINDMQSLPAEAASRDDKGKKPVDDLRYIVPGKAQVRIYDNTDELYNGMFPMAQLGYVEHLGGDLFNKKFATHVYLSPETGGLVKLEAEQP